MSILIQGILLGGLYCLASLGLSLVFGVLRLVNLAHGSFLVTGALLTSVALERIGGNPLLDALGVSLIIGFLAFVLQWLVITPIMRKKNEASISATFAIGIAIQSLLLLFLGSDPRVINASFSTSNFTFLGTSIRVSLLVSLILAIVFTIGISRILAKTRFGAEVQASSVDPFAAELIGINVNRRYATIFAMAAFVTSFAGAVIGITFAVDPTSGLGWLVRAFTVVVLGGLGSIYGTFVGGLVVGIVEAFGANVFGPQYRDVIVFGLFVIVLLVRPQGLTTLGKSFPLKSLYSKLNQKSRKMNQVEL